MCDIRHVVNFSAAQHYCPVTGTKLHSLVKGTNTLLYKGKELNHLHLKIDATAKLE